MKRFTINQENEPANAPKELKMINRDEIFKDVKLSITGRKSAGMISVPMVYHKSMTDGIRIINRMETSPVRI